MKPPPPLPILLLITDLHLGGSPLIALSLAIGLRDTGHWLPTLLSIAPLPPSSSTLSTQHSALSTSSSIPQRLHAANIPIESLNISSPIQFPLALHRYIRFVKKTKPALIHSLLIHANTLATLAQPFLRPTAVGGANGGTIPLIHSIHTLQPNPRWHWTLERLLLPHAAALIAPHPTILQKLNAPSPPSITIPNGINISRFKNATPLDPALIFSSPPPSPSPSPDFLPLNPLPQSKFQPLKNGQKKEENGENPLQNYTKPLQNLPQKSLSAFSIQNSTFSPILIGYLGRFDPVKRLDLLLKAFATLVQTKPYGKNLRLALVGYGPEEKNLKSLATSLHIAPQTLFPGPTSTPERWYKSFQILCLPSTVEGFALTIVEALAAGIPIVAPHSPALDKIFPPDTINHSGASGTLTSSADPDILASAIHEVITDPNANSPASVSQRLALAEPYSDTRMITAYHNFFTNFLPPAT